MPISFAPDAHNASLQNPISLGLSSNETACPKVDQTDPAQLLAALNDLVARVSESSSPKLACQALAHNLQSHFGIHRVLVGYRAQSTDRFEFAADSSNDEAADSIELATLVEAVSLESVTRGGSGQWPAEGSNRHSLCAHRQLCQLLEQPAILSLPMAESVELSQVVCVLVGEPCGLNRTDFRSFMSAVEKPLWVAFRLLQRAEGVGLERLLRKLKLFNSGDADNLAHSKNRIKRIAVVILLAAFVLLLPVRYRVAATCELQPVVHRFVAAPIDARLERSFVQPGDVVTAGQLLARIDASDVQWDLAAKNSEFDRVAKELSGFEATHESGKAAVARLELQRLQLVIEQLESQAAELEVCSPIDGIVLMGDHTEHEGVPLEKGQTLFEISPLDRMHLELEIPEDDIRFIQTGMTAHVRLAANPWEPFDGKIEHLFPRAELKDHQNVFIARVSLDNHESLLRPGMRGQATISTVWRPLGWTYFHKAYAVMLTWLGW